MQKDVQRAVEALQRQVAEESLAAPDIHKLGKVGFKLRDEGDIVVSELIKGGK